MAQVPLPWGCHSQRKKLVLHKAGDEGREAAVGHLPASLLPGAQYLPTLLLGPSRQPALDCPHLRRVTRAHLGGSGKIPAGNPSRRLLKISEKTCVLFKTRRMKIGDVIPSKALITKHSVFPYFSLVSVLVQGSLLPKQCCTIISLVLDKLVLHMEWLQVGCLIRSFVTVDINWFINLHVQKSSVC